MPKSIVIGELLVAATALSSAGAAHAADVAVLSADSTEHAKATSSHLDVAAVGVGDHARRPTVGPNGIASAFDSYTESCD